ncbi:hypothetical protein CNEO3_1650001 [Clostridium neonatale]|uniref:Uncharacterized protein n=1 Tax=Clostridium neonatale TaxID=137838 RepID=A0AAD2DF67_9CLOT|nr:hypothetical protein CNEO2_2760001 [Clostridium neonatale]CAI3202414.1 hypothetical protein CNEO2_2790001 [Clostridium neonatale]CAI3209728.1 hypothetical protein CNEO2_4370001 [Clostridium neonatale]CAI3236802.1 hypothetical protein CNEO2_2740001 [Clostridium neonatale]CAI3237697.1 hypothetical protein CNEO2_2930001 [Clostridium neonatale]
MLICNKIGDFGIKETQSGKLMSTKFQRNQRFRKFMYLVMMA